MQFDKLNDDIEPIACTIPETKRLTGESRSKIYQHLADGTYTAVKSGTKTLVLYASVKARFRCAPARRFQGAAAEAPPARINRSAPARPKAKAGRLQRRIINSIRIVKGRPRLRESGPFFVSARHGLVCVPRNGVRACPIAPPVFSINLPATIFKNRRASPAPCLPPKVLSSSLGHQQFAGVSSGNTRGPRCRDGAMLSFASGWQRRPI